MPECKWNYDEFCVNNQCLYRADYCECTQYPEVCRFYEPKEADSDAVYCGAFSPKENPDDSGQMHKLSNDIYDKLGQGELLCQLSEEASELGKAALKLRRAYGLTNNPTPVSAEDAYDNLIEEIADVRLCLTMLGLDRESAESKIREIEDYKLARWHSRIFSEEKQEA